MAHSESEISVEEMTSLHLLAYAFNIYIPIYIHAISSKRTNVNCVHTTATHIMKT